MFSKYFEPVFNAIMDTPPRKNSRGDFDPISLGQHETGQGHNYNGPRLSELVWNILTIDQRFDGQKEKQQQTTLISI